LDSESARQLDRWLADPAAEPRLLVSSPAGRGKSALLAKWMEALKASHTVAADRWRLVFVPISNRFQTNRPSVYLQLLTRQLAHIAGEHIIPPSSDPEAFYRGTASRLITSLAMAGHSLLLVFDGLDEALGEERLPNLLPAILPATLKVVVSARWLAGDRDGSGWLTRLGWGDGEWRAAHDLVVEALDVASVGDVLVKMAAPIDVAGRDKGLVTQLASLTEGEPLLLRFYAEDLWLKSVDEGPISLAALDGMEPGFGPYFKAWLQDQGGLVAEGGSQVDPRTTDATLAILGFACSGLTGRDLLDVGAAGWPNLPWRLQARPHVVPFRRFIIGDGSKEFPYNFSHPKVGDYIRTDECAELADQTAAAFFVWGRSHIGALNDGKRLTENASRYALDHYTDHLTAVGTTATVEDYLAVVEDGWRRAKEHRDGGTAGFAALQIADQAEKNSRADHHPEHAPLQ
jgi:NACHT domain